MRKVMTRDFAFTRSPRLRVAMIDGRIRSEHRLYYLWTAGSEEPETSGDSPIQNDSDLSQGHRGRLWAHSVHQSARAFHLGRREGDYDAPLFARPPVVGSA